MQIQWSCENFHHPQKFRTSKRRWFVAATIAPPETSFSSQSFFLSLAYLLPCSHLSTSLKSNLSKRIGSYVKERLSQKPRSGPVQDLSYGDLDLSGNQKTAPHLFPRTIYVRPSPLPVINSSIGADNRGYQRAWMPPGTHHRGHRNIQMAELEPPVLPWNLMNLEWFARE